MVCMWVCEKFASEKKKIDKVYLDYVFLKKFASRIYKKYNKIFSIFTNPPIQFLQVYSNVENF